jgi:hypothetical protein
MPCAAVEGRFAVDTGGIVAGGFVEMSVPIGVPAPAAPTLQGIFRVGIMGSDIHGENREEGVRTKPTGLPMATWESAPELVLPPRSRLAFSAAPPSETRL